MKIRHVAPILFATLGMVTLPAAGSAEPAVAAQLRLSFGAGESRLSLGLGAQEQLPGALRTASRPVALRPLAFRPLDPQPLAFRPLLEVSGRLTASAPRLEDLRLDGLALRSWALYADEGADGGEGEDAEEGDGGRAALAVVGVVVGVAVLGALLADSFGEDLGDALAGE